MRRGFTLVEAIVVTGIIGLLAGIAIPAIQRVRGLADRVACLNNLRQIGTALHLYHTDYKRLPPQPSDFNHELLSNNPNVSLGWMALILPYIDHGPLWTQSVKACQLDTQTFHNPPHVGYSTVVKLYICPTDNRISVPLTPPGSNTPTAYGSYLGNEGTVFHHGVLGSDLPGIRFTQIRDA
jgi:prepilin-type N-terminal cleavage/methylation domain-containing protein